MDWFKDKGAILLFFSPEGNMDSYQNCLKIWHHHCLPATPYVLLMEEEAKFVISAVMKFLHPIKIESCFQSGYELKCDFIWLKFGFLYTIQYNTCGEVVTLILIFIQKSDKKNAYPLVCIACLFIVFAFVLINDLIFTSIV